MYYDAFLDFLISQKGRYAADKVPQNIQEMIERMQKSPRALVASMIFMIEETNLLASVLNLSQRGGGVLLLYSLIALMNCMQAYKPQQNLGGTIPVWRRP